MSDAKAVSGSAKASILAVRPGTLIHENLHASRQVFSAQTVSISPRLSGESASRLSRPRWSADRERPRASLVLWRRFRLRRPCSGELHVLALMQARDHDRAIGFDSVPNAIREFLESCPPDVGNDQCVLEGILRDARNGFVQAFEERVAQARFLRLMPRISLLVPGVSTTAFSAMKLAGRAAGHIRVAHVPKTIDNDLDLSCHLDTFGFRRLVISALRSCRISWSTRRPTSGRCLAIAMGRTAGHLALGIGNSDRFDRSAGGAGEDIRRASFGRRACLRHC
jgi:hypothetical protein